MPAWPKDSDDAARRIGFSQRRWVQCRGRHQQRLASLGLVHLFLTSLMLVCGCGPAPQVTYDDARLKLKRGQTEAAKEETDRAYQRYASENSIWHWRFKVLKAEILARQGSNEQSLELLKAEPPSSFQTADLAVRRKLVQGVASAWAQHP